MAEASGKTSSRKFVTDVELKALRPGQTATDSPPGRGSGSILFECRTSGAVEAYYRRRGEGGQKVKIGVFKKTPKSQVSPLLKFASKLSVSPRLPQSMATSRPIKPSVLLRRRLGRLSANASCTSSNVSLKSRLQKAPFLSCSGITSKIVGARVYQPSSSMSLSACYVTTWRARK